jgi:hypothetical protein
MPSIVDCPECGRRLRVLEELVGKPVQCPLCTATFPAVLEAIPSPLELQPHRGALILVLGLLSIVACNFLAPFAWYLGTSDLEDMRLGRRDPQGEALTKAGRICGLVGTILMVVQFFCLMIGFVVLVAMKK